MTGLINLSCFGGGGNTGNPTCDILPELIKMGILIPKGMSWTEAQIYAAGGILPLLVTAATATNAAARIYPILEFQGMEPTSEERTQQTGGYGARRTVRRGKISWSFQMWGGKCLHTALMGFDDRAASFDLLLVDENGIILGRETSTGGFGGFSLSDLYVGDYMLADGTNGAMWEIAFELSSSVEWNTDSRYIGTNNAFRDLRGLRNITLRNATPGITPTPAVGTYWLDITTDCGTTNLMDIYATELAIAGNWSATNATDGGVISITSRTATVFQGRTYLVFVFDTADADWTLGEDVRLQAANTSVLAANGIIGYEANPSFVVLPN